MRSEKDKMIAGELYNPADSELSTLRSNARLCTEKMNRCGVEQKEERAAVAKSLFGKTGGTIYIETGFQCDYGFNIQVGENFYANYDCVILDVAPVVFGDNCMLGPQVGIYTATHPLDPIERNSGKEYAKPILIGHNCWIGGHATINPGVTLGDNVVVASGAVVTKSFGSNIVLGGNPAKIIKVISDSNKQ